MVEIQRWSDKESYISASKVQVSSDWGDPIQLNFTETGLGPRFSLDFGEDRQVQFYFTNHDWRQNQTYRYKLTNSWLSKSGEEDEDGSGSNWLFWNINSFIDSQMILPEGYDAFTCDYVELPYWSSALSKQVIPDAKLLMYDFTIGFLVPENRQPVYNPCRNGGRCRVIDGEVTCGNAVYVKYGLFALLALGLLFCCVADQCIRGIRNMRGTSGEQYRQVGQDEHDGDKHQTSVELTHIGNAHADDEEEEEFLDEIRVTA